MIKNLIVNNISQSLQFGSRWLLNITLARYMSLSEFGVFSFLYSISNILMAVLPFGSSVYIFKDIDNKGQVFIVIDSIVVILFSFLFTLFILILFVLFGIKTNGVNYLIYPLILGLLLSLNLVFSSYLKSLGKFTSELKAYLLFSFFILMSIILINFIKTVNLSYIFLYLIFVNSIILLYFLLHIKLRREKLTYSFSFRKTKSLFQERLYYGLQEIQTAIYGQFSMILLFYLLNTEMYGVFRTLLIMVMPISLISYSFTQVFIIYLRKNKERICFFFRRILFFSIIVALSIVGLITFFHDLLFSMVNLNEVYYKIFVVLLFGVTVKIVMSSYVALLVVLNKQKIRFYASFIASFFLIFSLFLFVGKYDLVNSILIYILSILIVFIIKVIYAERSLKSENCNYNL